MITTLVNCVFDVIAILEEKLHAIRVHARVVGYVLRYGLYGAMMRIEKDIVDLRHEIGYIKSLRN